jgi:T-complex protein 1 subunit gamma
MVNKDVTHPKMRRRIENPRVLLLDCPLEYKKAESQTALEVEKEDDWNAILKQEEDYIEKICSEIIAFRPDIVITEKGVSGAFVCLLACFATDVACAWRDLRRFILHWLQIWRSISC